MSDGISHIVPEMPKSANEDMQQWAKQLDHNLRAMRSTVNSGFGRQYTEVNNLLKQQNMDLRNEINKLKQEINNLQKIE